MQVVEKLYRLSWTRLDGLGGLVLTPTRELALQIFEELVKVSAMHGVDMRSNRFFLRVLLCADAFTD